MTTPIEPGTYTLPLDLLKPSSQTRHTLLQHLRLLHLLHHRNKNQHRRSQWFRHFSTFRREAGRACTDLGIDVVKGVTEEAQDADRKLGSKVVKEKKSNVQAGVTLNLNKQQDRASIRRKCSARVTYWVQSKLMTKWYTAFTTLAATPSFAALSLTLLALFARVCSILGVTTLVRAIGDVEEQEQLAKDEQEIQEALAKFAEVDALKLWEDNSRLNKHITRPTGDDSGQNETSDTGVVVSRQKVAYQNSASPSIELKTTQQSKKTAYKSKITSSPLILSEEDSGNAAKTSKTTTASSIKKRKLELGDNISRQTSQSTIPRKKKKPKNEIDALFAGLG